MLEAAAAGLDPADGWNRTPGELNEYLDGFRKRMEILSYWGYNLAQGIASMLLAATRPAPWEVFPGWIPRRDMTDDEIAANLMAWCSR